MIALIMLDSSALSPCCGIAFVLIIIGIIAGVAGEKARESNKESKESKSYDYHPEITKRPFTSTTAFQSFVSIEKKKFGDLELDAFTVEMQGSVCAPMDNCPVMKTITLFDITKGEDDQKPVLCSINNLQYKNTTAFFFSNLDILPFVMSLISEWQPMLSIPIESLTFPARGKRRLLFSVSLTSLDGAVLAQAQSEFTYMNTRPGYIDNMKSRLRSAELAVKLAVSVSAIDGNFAGTEGHVVKEWIKKRIASSVESQQQEVKEKLNSAVESSMNAVSNADPGDIISFTNDLIEMNPVPASAMGDKYDILDLCLKVASADGKAMDTELELVNSLAESLGVDRERFRSMTEKILPVNIHQTEDVNTILGLDPSWTTEQKRKHLRAENRKWRALATHSDPAKQLQAKQMQDLIAKEMAVLESSDE